MAKKDSLKIITTGVLVASLLSVFVVAFLNRADLSNKLQSIGSSPKEDRLILLERKEPQSMAILPKPDPIPELAQTPKSEMTKMEKSDASKTEESSKMEPKDPKARTESKEEKSKEDKTKASVKETPKEPPVLPLEKPEIVEKPKYSKNKVVARREKKRRTRISRKAPPLDRRLAGIEKQIAREKDKNERRFQQIEERIEKIEKVLQEKP